MDAQGDSKQPLVGYGMNANGKRPLDTLENEEIITKKMRVDGEALFIEGLIVPSAKQIQFPSSINPVLDSAITNNADGLGIRYTGPALFVDTGMIVQNQIKMTPTIGGVTRIVFERDSLTPDWEITSDIERDALFIRDDKAGQDVIKIADADRKVTIFEDTTCDLNFECKQVTTVRDVVIRDGGQQTLGSTSNVAQIKCYNILLTSGAALLVSQLCKIDNTGRVVPVLSADPATVASIGFTMDAAVGAGETIRVCNGGIFRAIVENGLTINPGETLIRSAVDDGRVATDIVGVTPGLVGVALTGGTGDVGGTVSIQGLFIRNDTN